MTKGNRYVTDDKGRLVETSYRTSHGTTTHIDAKGHLKGTSYETPGGTTYIDASGRLAGTSYGGYRGGTSSSQSSSRREGTHPPYSQGASNDSGYDHSSGYSGPQSESGNPIGGVLAMAAVIACVFLFHGRTSTPALPDSGRTTSFNIGSTDRSTDVVKTAPAVPVSNVDDFATLIRSTPQITVEPATQDGCDGLAIRFNDDGTGGCAFTIGGLRGTLASGAKVAIVPVSDGARGIVFALLYEYAKTGANFLGILPGNGTGNLAVSIDGGTIVEQNGDVTKYSTVQGGRVVTLEPPTNAQPAPPAENPAAGTSSGSAGSSESSATTATDSAAAPATEAGSATKNDAALRFSFA